jgi:hypothetical protein
LRSFTHRLRTLPARRQYDPLASQPHGQLPLGGLVMASCAPWLGTQNEPLDV